MLIPVILSGGDGTRLWPLSRRSYPKQLINLFNNHSLIQSTLLRCKEITNYQKPIIICNESHRFIIKEQIDAIGYSDASIILEPIPRNTAPAVAIAAFHALTEHDNPTLLVMPADHTIKDVKAFKEAVNLGFEISKNKNIITFGAEPTRPETGYGYIKKGKQEFNRVFKIDEFVEKPSVEIAEQYLHSKSYLWNTGVFMLSAKLYLHQLKIYAPKILDISKKSFAARTNDLSFTVIPEGVFKECPSDSIDYAVMQQTDRGLVIPVNMEWSDIGSWESLYDVIDKNESNNSIIGDVYTESVENSYLHSNERMIVALGLKNHVVVETKDTVLVADKSCSQQVKDIVEKLKDEGRSEATANSKVYRPWGSYESLLAGDRFQVKFISINPGAKLSLQKHYHRFEHWIVVKGTALVTKGEQTLLLSENESTFIPLGMLHRVENTGKLDLEIIEIQTGAYLGEDDIVRYEDDYNRVEELEEHA